MTDMRNKPTVEITPEMIEVAADELERRVDLPPTRYRDVAEAILKAALTQNADPHAKTSTVALGAPTISIGTASDPEKFKSQNSDSQ